MPLCGDAQTLGAGVIYFGYREYERSKEADALAEKCKVPALQAAAGAALAKSTAEPTLSSAQQPTSNSGLNPFATVQRELEGVLRETYFRPTGKYSAVLGPRGCGKSVVALAAAYDRVGDGFAPTACSGVLWIIAKHHGDAVQQILRKLGPGDGTQSAFDAMVKIADLETLVPVFRAAIAAYKATHPKAPEEWVPTVIMELDRGLSPNDVGEVCRVAKWLACEKCLAAVVLVLSDAGTSGIPSDKARQVCAVW